MTLIPCLVFSLLLASPQESLFKELSIQEDGTPPAFTDLQWQRFDAETRWHHYREATSEDPRSRGHWVMFLGRQQDYRLLEWIVLYDDFLPLNSWLTAGNALVEGDAPQWIRTAVWTLEHIDSHTFESSDKSLRAHPRKALGWMIDHTDALGPRGRALMQELNRSGHSPIQDRRYLPPLDPEAVLAHLSPPDSLSRFDPEKGTQPDTVYEQQVLRAIHGTIANKRFSSPWEEKLLALTHHQSDVVRRRALLAFSYFPAELVPHRPLMARLEALENAHDRTSAVLAVGKSSHPAVWLLLQDLLVDPDEPAWEAVAQSLASGGDSWTESRLERVRGTLAEPQQVAEADKLLAELRKRLNKGKAPNKSKVQRWLERAAWAALSDDPKQQDLVAWTLERLSNSSHQKTIGALKKIATAYQAPPYDDEARQVERFEKLVKRFARECLGDG